MLWLSKFVIFTEFVHFCDWYNQPWRLNSVIFEKQEQMIAINMGSVQIDSLRREFEGIPSNEEILAIAIDLVFQ
jgi:hypothetical protein